MKIDQAEFLNQYNANRINKENDKKEGVVKGEDGESQFKQLMDSYIPEEAKDDNVNAAYRNPKFSMNTMVMERLMKETEEIQGSVHQMIRGLLDRQGITESQLKSGNIDDIDVDKLAQEKAQELLGPGGALSPEAVSDRIVSFSIAVFGGDTSKIDIIRSSIDRGFDEAERMLGGLADVSKDTYQLIQDKLDKWVNDGEVPEAPEPIPGDAQ
jgi:uncharacterized protein DUF5610